MLNKSDTYWIAKKVFTRKGVKKNMKLAVESPYQLIPEGQYTVTVLSVEESANSFYKEGEPEHKKTRLTWNLEMPDGISTIKFWTGTNIGSNKANLTKLVAAVLGKRTGDLTEAEKKKFDTDDAIGKKVLIKVIHKEDDEGQTWHRIDSVKPVPKKGKKDDLPF